MIAPQPGTGQPGTGQRAAGITADAQHAFPVVRVRSVPFPGYRSVRLGLASPAIRRALLGHRAELVHLASPFFLGALGSRAARRLRLPVVAVYQTDVPGYARAYHWGRAAEAAAWRWLRGIHNAADRTLAPSSPGVERLAAHGVQRVWMWGRGVDTQRFSPAARSEALRRALAPGGEVLAGYVGRLAPEKQVELLAGVAALPGVRLVIVGGGPEPRLGLMPSAVFLGQHRGGQLACIFAGLAVRAQRLPRDVRPDHPGGGRLRAARGGPGGGRPGSPRRRRGHRLPGPSRGRSRAGRRHPAAGRRPGVPGRDGPGGPAAGAGRSWAALGDQLIGHYAAVLGERSGGPGDWLAGEWRATSAMPCPHSICWRAGRNDVPDLVW